MLPNFDLPPAHHSNNKLNDGKPDLRALPNKKKTGKYARTTILIVIFALAGWGVWKILPYIPGVPQYVRLKSATFLRSPHVYRSSKLGYDPLNTLLAPEWIDVMIDRERNEAIFRSLSTEVKRVALGKPQWIQSCENQFMVESFMLPEYLEFGSISFQKPILIAACDMWAVGEKIRPGRLVIMDATQLEEDPFYLGMECESQHQTCMSFAESLGVLSIIVIDKNNKQVLPNANIVISSGLGVQEFEGSFKLQIYTALQLSYQISLTGYVGKRGEISNFYGNKLEVMYWTNAEQTQGTGDIFDFTANEQEVEYKIELVEE